MILENNHFPVNNNDARLSDTGKLGKRKSKFGCSNSAELQESPVNFEKRQYIRKTSSNIVNGLNPEVMS